MRILWLARTVTDHDRRFTAALAGAGHDVRYLALDAAEWPAAPGLPDGVRWERWSAEAAAPATPEACLALLAPLKAVLERVSPDAVHAGPVPTAAYLTALSGFRPYVAMAWGSDVLVHAERDGWLEPTRHALRDAARVVTDCATVTARVRELADVDAAAVVEFPWGTDLERFRPDMATGWRAPLPFNDEPDATVVLSTRSWEPLYGTDVLVDGFRRAHERDPRLRLVLLAGGSLAPAIDRIVTEHGLEDAVARPGLIDHEALPAHFGAADLYVSAALSDGTSVSLLEALATGTPVLVTDNPSNREWIEPGVHGWLAEPDSAESFAQGMLEAARLTPERRRAMARRNRTIAEERADWERNIAKLLAAYDGLHSRERGGPHTRSGPETDADTDTRAGSGTRAATAPATDIDSETEPIAESAAGTTRPATDGSAERAAGAHANADGHGHGERSE